MRTDRSIDITQVIEWNDTQIRSCQDYLAAEEPLEMRINGSSVNVTMRTPGHDTELLAGFLLTEGLIRDGGEISSLRQVPGDHQKNVIEARLEREISLENFRRDFSAGSSCGVCGKASIEFLRRREIRSPNPHFHIDPGRLCGLPQKLREGQAVFGRTGGLHAAALFNRQGELLVLREDVGRHNAVDKIVGWALLQQRLPLSDHMLMVSGRGGFEIIQKALAAGIPVMASVSAPSSLAVRLAREFNLTLIGFLRGQRFVVYSGIERILHQELPAPQDAVTTAA